MEIEHLLMSIGDILKVNIRQRIGRSATSRLQFRQTDGKILATIAVTGNNVAKDITTSRWERDSASCPSAGFVSSYAICTGIWISQNGITANSGLAAGLTAGVVAVTLHPDYFVRNGESAMEMEEL